jgi:hypothetical protein
LHICEIHLRASAQLAHLRQQTLFCVTSFAQFPLTPSIAGATLGAPGRDLAIHPACFDFQESNETTFCGVSAHDEFVSLLISKRHEIADAAGKTDSTDRMNEGWLAFPLPQTARRL